MPMPVSPGPGGMTVPPSAAATLGLSRRSFLRAAAIGGTLLGTGLLSACGDDGGGASSNTVTFGMNEAGDIAPAQRLRAMARAFTEKTGIKVERNEVSHNTFQEQINNYLQGNPDDVFTWFAGYRMQQMAEQGLIADISDVWPIDGLNESFKEASTFDGNQYFVPASYYPWAVFYRKSVFEENGWQAPETEDEFISLMEDMQGAGVTPFAFGDKDGWPAMGTFDILNMRLNGYDFHMALMRGEEAWDSPEVRSVFEKWRELLPYHQSAALGRTWQEAAESMASGDCGMYLLGTFVVDAIPDTADDLDFFTYPELNSSIGSGALDAPINGFCVAAATDNLDTAKQFIGFLGTAEAADAANDAADAPFIAANSNASQGTYEALQKKSVEVVQEADNIAQFLDRDTDAAFASTVIIPSLQTFLAEPGDIDGITTSIQEQKVSIFGS